MSEPAKNRVQAQFGETAEHYATSEIHAQGESLRVLRDVVNPRQGWTVLDVASGAGHTAFTFAPHVARVVAADLTDAMTRKTVELAAERGLGNVSAVVADAEDLPLRDHTVDVVTCRLAFHHFPNPARAIAEWRRVLTHDGILALADNVTVDDDESAAYYNAYERLRDPSHHRVYSLAELCRLLRAGGLRVEAARTLTKELEFAEWADRQRVTRADRQTLREMMRRLPAPLTALLAPRWADGTMYFSLWEAVLVARRTERSGSDR